MILCNAKSRTSIATQMIFHLRTSCKDVYMLMIETTLAKKTTPISPIKTLSGPLGLLGSLDGGVVLLLLGGVLDELGLVLGNRLLLALGLPLLERSEVSGPLESLGGNESLDGRGLGVGLAGFSGDLSTVSLVLGR
jgi:hypothetical protein